MSDAARAWLRAQVMDMGDCEEELVASLTALLTETRTKALSEKEAENARLREMLEDALLEHRDDGEGSDHWSRRARAALKAEGGEK